MTYGTGDVYEGSWRDGKRNGVGTLSRRNGDRYKGDWEDDRRHGLGREAFGNGDKYEGNYRCDKPEGTVDRDETLCLIFFFFSPLI